MFFFFFFQAEDGIRDVAVTGVQTCALPISPAEPPARWPANARATPVPVPHRHSGHALLIVKPPPRKESRVRSRPLPPRSHRMTIRSPEYALTSILRDVEYGCPEQAAFQFPIGAF